MTVGRDANTVSVGGGTIYMAPLGTAEPTTVSGPWTSWVDLGYTEKGLTFSISTTTADVLVDEEFYALSTSVTAKSGRVAFALSQLTSKNLQVANNGGTITTTGGYTVFTPPAPGVEQRIMLAWAAAALDESYIWRKCFQVGNAATQRSKVLPQALLPVEFNVEKPAGADPWIYRALAARSGA